MPGDEQTKKVENHACLVGHYRLYRCISRTTTRRGINKIPKCFSCPGDCKELSKKTKQSTYDSRTMYQAMADPSLEPRPTYASTSCIACSMHARRTQTQHVIACSMHARRIRVWRNAFTFRVLQEFITLQLWLTDYMRRVIRIARVLSRQWSC